MKIHEYQAKAILKEFGITVPFGKMATRLDQVPAIIDELPSPAGVVKAQIHAGGRGKGGGVKLAKNAAEIQEHAKNILGMNLITLQTSSEGQKVSRILIEQTLQIKKELYFSILLDREKKSVILLASTEGGMDIEEVAAKMPEKILKQEAHNLLGLRAYQARNLAFRLGLQKIDKSLIGKATKIFLKFYEVFCAKDVSLLEINPLVITEQNEILPLDCKMSFDENALIKHPELLDLRDTSQEEAAEIEASKYGLNFIKLEGNIGCMVNGAGLAMATMDIIQYYGGKPANFLDVGGGTSAEKVAAAFRIISSDSNVRSILINIFGGIVRCDLIAEGILKALQTIDLKIPVIVRLEGTNAEIAKKIIENQQNSGLILINDLKQATQKVIAMAKT
jgi:succinyl-CoA synthetase beta subunit